MNAPETSADVAQRLEQKGIRPTANRILVLRELLLAGRALSLADVVARLPLMDKSSIFRCLTLFVEHDAVHAFGDGRGVFHYEPCADHGACAHRDGHVHFYCRACGRTFCLPHTALPQVVLPEGFEARSFSFVVDGVCAQCRRRGK